MPTTPKLHTTIKRAFALLEYMINKGLADGMSDALHKIGFSVANDYLSRMLKMGPLSNH